MNRRDFSRQSLVLGLGALAGPAGAQSPEYYNEAARRRGPRRRSARLGIAVRASWSMRTCEGLW